MEVAFVIPGQPHGKERPRFNTQMRHTYTPKKTADYEISVRKSYTEQCGKTFFGDNPICVHICAYFSIPKSWSNTKREKAINGAILPIGKPDLDNIAKAICDALNGVAYDDDAQIVLLDTTKKYAENPRVEVEIDDFSPINCAEIC